MTVAIVMLLVVFSIVNNYCSWKIKTVTFLYIVLPDFAHSNFILLFKIIEALFESLEWMKGLWREDEWKIDD